MTLYAKNLDVSKMLAKSDALLAELFKKRENKKKTLKIGDFQGSLTRHAGFEPATYRFVVDETVVFRVLFCIKRSELYEWTPYNL